MTRNGPSIAMALAVALSGILSQVRANDPATGDEDVANGASRSAAEGGVRRWRVEAEGELPLRDAPSADAAALDRIAGGTVLSNLGCAIVEGRAWCEVRPLRRGRPGYLPAEALRPARGPDGIVPTGVDDSAARARKRDFDARGEVSCAQERGQEPFVCAAGVARGDGGDATVVVTFPNGFERALHFAHGELVSASATMSGSGTDTDWRRSGDRHLVRVDDQRYELPDPFLFGR